MFDIRYFDTVDSTMDIVRDLASQGIAEGLVVQGGEQTGGRGRRGNTWTSPKGNLYQSILLRPSVARMRWGELSFVIAVALADTVLQCGVDDEDIALKWPNDVLVKGEKLAGILIEAGDDFVIVGTGVNIQLAPEDKARLSDYTDLSIDQCRDIFLGCIKHYYSMWQETGFAPIREKWMGKAYRLHEMIQARTPQSVHEGVFEGLDENGTLLLRLKNGEVQKVTSGEIINVFGN